MSTGQLNGVLRRIQRLTGLKELDASSDGELLELFVKERDEGAFEVLLERHGPMVLGVCRRVLQHAQDVDDAFQATFLVFLRKATSIRPREMVGNWLYGVAFRTALKAKSMAAKRKLKENQGNTMKRQTPLAGDTWEDLQPVLDEELERLPDKYRSLIVLCDLEGKPRKEVAEKLQLAEGTLSSRLATARQMLAKRLARRGISLTAGALAALITENVASASVPSALASATLKAVHAVAAGGVTAGAVSSSVSALSEGVLKAMFLTKLKSLVAVLVVGALCVGGVFSLATGFAQQPEPKKDASAKTPEQPKKEDAKTPKTSKQPAKQDPPKKVDPFPLESLKQRLKKHEDEAVKIRKAMLKEIAEEEAKLDELIKKEEAAFKGGDRSAFQRGAALKHKKMELWHIKVSTEQMIRIQDNTPAALTEEQRLGIHVGTPSATLVKQLALPQGQGLVLDKVAPKSPAEKAGLKASDILLKIDGKAVPSDKKAFHKILAGLKTDTAFEAVVLREGKQQTIQGVILPGASTASTLQAPVAPTTVTEPKKTDK